MPIRRIVTATRNGRSVVDSDIAVDDVAFATVPGFASTPLWGSQGPAGGMVGERLPTVLPPRSGSRFLVVSFPPDAVFADPAFDGAAAAAEQQRLLGDLAASFEPDALGMHRTDTLDYAVVLSGTPALELDDGAVLALAPGDTIVQQAVRHAWRNPGSEPATIAFVMLGNEQAPPA